MSDVCSGCISMRIMYPAGAATSVQFKIENIKEKEDPCFVCETKPKRLGTWKYGKSLLVRMRMQLPFRSMHITVDCIRHFFKILFDSRMDVSVCVAA